MTFTHKDWKDDPDSTTPLSATALEDLEDRLAAYADTVAAGKQPLDSDLTAIAALTTTSYGRALLALADAAAARTALGLGSAATGATTDFQPADSDLTAIAALSTTSFGRSFLTLADAAAARAALGSGTPASGTYLDGAGSWLSLPAQSGSAEDVLVSPTVLSADNVQAALAALKVAIDNATVGGLPAGAGLVYVQESQPDEGAFPWQWYKPSTGAQVFYAPDGAPTAPSFTVDPVITGTGVVGDTLTCDGGTVTGTPTITKTYQWENAGVAISGETASTYVVQAGDVGDALTCTVTATNTGGTDSATSNSITGSAAATAPGQVTGLDATAGDAQVDLAWTAPASNGGSAITTYLVEYRTPAGSGSYTTFTHSASTTPSITVTGLTNGSEYEFRVSAVNAVGTGTPSATATATPAAAGSNDFPTEAALDSPIGAWDLDETSGTTAADSSGAGRDGTIEGTPTLGAASIVTGIAGSMEFDGTAGDLVRIADNPAFDFTGPFTIEAWATIAGAITANRRLVTHGEPGGFGGFSFGNSGSGLNCTFFDVAANSTATDAGITIDTPHHFLMRLKANNDLDFFVDGVNIGTVTSAGPPNVSPRDLLIGAGSGLDDVPWIGRVAGVRLYNTDLSDARVAAHYAAGTS